MFRKFSAVFLVFALLLQLFPAPAQKANAAVGNGSFVFPSVSSDPNSYTITTDGLFTLQGSINNVNPNKISYSIYQIIDDKNDVIGSSRLDQSNNVYTEGNSITVFNVALFPGKNKITFKGVQSGGEVSDSFYIDYRNGPLFYNLTAQIDGQAFPVQDGKTTVVHSAASKGRSTYDISLTGNAPNAQSVTIIVNGNSKTYNVNQSNNNSFVASPINLKKGKNLVTIRVKNNSQTLETTREIAFYNGSVTYYDVNINEGTDNGMALEYYPNYNYTANGKGNVQITGKVIVPNSEYADVPNGQLEPHPDPAWPVNSTSPLTSSKLVKVNYKLMTGTTTSVSGSVYATSTSTNPKDKFFVYEFTLSPADLVSTGLADDTLYNLQLMSDNEVNKHLNITPISEGTSDLGFRLQNGSSPYIYEVNYLQSYNGTNYENITGGKLDGANLFAMPFGVEILIGNPTAYADNEEAVVINSIKDVSGKTYNLTDNPPKFSYKRVNTQAGDVTTVTKMVNGLTKTFYRLVYEFDEMPVTGTQTINFKMLAGSAAVKPTTVNLLYGPFVNYAKAVDGLIISVDTTLDEDLQAKYVITDMLGDFAGTFKNIPNVGDIKYDGPTAGDNRRQTVFFYINNSLVPLKQDTNGKATDFVLAEGTAQGDISLKDAYNKFFTGENSIRILYQSDKDYYEKTIKVNIVPTNLPVIPAPGTSGVFPYSKQYDKPLPNDPNFPMRGSIYTTTLSEMNIFGTFDFIDLGTDETTVSSKLAGIATTIKEKYILKITTPAEKDPWMWDLSQSLELMRNGEIVTTINPGSDLGNLSVQYDLESQTFSFILKNQKLNKDGSPKIYNFFVYNSGEAGPRASYRLEVDPTAIPYSLLRPILPQKNIVNQNFIEVVIDAPGADKIIIKGGDVKSAQMEKIDFDTDNDGTIDYPGAFRYFVTGLKPGKANKIEFTISNKNDSSKDFIEIKYVPTNIPGAAFLETMKANHKQFDGSLNLKFPKGTTLIRQDFNVPQNLKNQIFDGHKLLFAIANPEDGVVDRREFETLPANFDLILESFGTRFNVSFPTHFTKSSPVFWIDAGLADDPSTTTYDPLTMGVDPYQFPGARAPNGSWIPTYDDRPDNRELMTSKIGTLELKYDVNMRDTVGTIITAFRYDVKNKYWENIGGVVDTKKHTITVPFSQFGYYVVGKMVYSYYDITQHPTAKNYMEAIYAKGVMNPVGYDQFGADLFTSRGEFARMMVKAANIPLNYELSKSHFDDVPYTINAEALWDYRYIETAAREGLIRGTTPRAFEPLAPVTKEQAAIIIARTLNLKLETDPKKINATLQKQFKDYTTIEYYARASVAAVTKKGFLTGTQVDPENPKKGFVFEPSSKLSRAEAAILVARVLADQKRLPKIY
ncbi:S-layer homology domain-containing protein [Cohnella terricola]|uniref:S-layer homology domain-containing protein n=1 Tax=Cohnella terricola TaxID=1289167 RepID=A0A559JB31_9BACL|nr:S-layer homology domain-containing protein [Cohnella terricola]TVX97086.1 S-layer homology domain-containing protein [Cohnella terricola]